MMQTVLVVDYDPLWPSAFECLRANVWQVLQDFAISVEHVGSTAVPGLAAKPIIDMTVVVATDTDVLRAIAQLATLGYRHQGNLGIEGREAFNNPPGLCPHHLYLCRQGSTGLRNHVSIRDYLRSDLERAKAYGELKKRLAQQYPHDIDAYIDGKTDFILGVLAKVGMSDNELQSIDVANRKA
jgi:GrpB-like predicted nucleotidyltransferase (UPF0157 family)